MKKKIWLAYLILYFCYGIWVRATLSSGLTFTVTDLFYLLMLLSVVGLALQRKIFTVKIWRAISGLGFLLFIHAWVILPFLIYRDEGIEWTKIGIIQLYAVPSLPIFIGLYVYAWQSPAIWNNSAQQGAQARPSKA